MFPRKLRKIFNNIDRLNRSAYLDVQKQELANLEKIFALLTNGSLVGLPAAPSHISLELFPLMEDDILMLLNSVDTSLNPLGELFSIFDID